MARVTLLSGTDRGHTYPVVGVALALRRRGHEVLVVTGRRRGPELDAAGVPWAPIPDAEPHDEGRDLSGTLWSWAAAAARPTAALLRAAGTDVVVSDVLMAAGGLAADVAGLPWIQLVPHHLADAAVELPPMGLGRHPSRLPWVRADDRLIHRRAERSRAEGRRDREVARAHLGLPGTGRPVLRLVASLPGLEYPRRRWPADAHLVGPLAWDPPEVGVGAADGADLLSWLDPDGPPVVVATDSTGTGARGGLAAVTVEALRGLDVQLVAITAPPRRSGAAEVSGGPTPWPLRCVVGHVPHHRALDRAAVTVAPGGAGVVGKSLRRGVPMVLAPDFGDQIEAAARVSWAGAGRRVRSARGLPPGALRRAVVRVLADDRYAQAAGRLAAEAAALGPDRAAALVEAVLAGTTPVATGPTRAA
ncbi:hypothetical protein FTX61_05135 [Nitriliruptoraceae bacterium ZYF776]|nr:hypothetical protein [Profundirhabdus halotolerans]